MGKITGFLDYTRKGMPYRDPRERIKDYKEVYATPSEEDTKTEAARCMDCGVPFCHQGCPLGNLIPDWNHLVYLNDWREAIDRLHATNNFPEMTGRLCPAPCENACVLAINAPAVSIKQVEKEIADRAFAEGWIRPQPPEKKTGKQVAVVGSGPAGLAAAQQLARAGHDVEVFERDDRIGGLLRYGIPEFKMEKSVIERRMAQMKAEGVRFHVNQNIGVDVPTSRLMEDFDAVILACGALQHRRLDLPGRELSGVHFAMPYLTQANRMCEGDRINPSQLVSAEGKHVVVIGGGDTGADCVATAHRQGARSVTQIQYHKEPPTTRPTDNPWPEWARVRRVSYAIEEGGEYRYSLLPREFVGEEGEVKRLKCAVLEWHEPGNGKKRYTEIDETEIDAELVLIAIGFSGPEKEGPIGDLELELDERGNVIVTDDYMTSRPGLFACGDMRRGQSLIVWAIAEGRDVAYHVDRYLMGESKLDVPGGVIHLTTNYT